MTSARKIKTNRANAQASTGPKTTQGKARAARNARRHGLSSSVLADPVLSAEAESLGDEMAGERATSEVRKPARRFVEAQIDLLRVRQARHDLLSRDLNDPEYRPKEFFRAVEEIVKIACGCLRQFGPEAVLPPEVAQHADDILYWKPQGAEKFAYILSDLASKLAAIDRYERRALSRRKFAIRDFDAERRTTKP